MLQVQRSPMLTVDRVLTLIDPSGLAPGALDQALVLTDRFDATLHVLPLPNGETTKDALSIRDRLLELVDERKHLLGMHPTITISSDTVDLHPRTAEDLLNYARTHDIDLIVADTPEDRGPIPAMASPSIGTLAVDAEIPLFVVEHCADAANFRRILVPTDFSDHARLALQHAKALADLYDASIDVLHVMERPQYVALNATDMLSLSDATLAERNAKRRLDDLLANTIGQDVPVRTHVLHGDAADQICHFVNAHPIDLVVLSTHGVISGATHRLGNVADKVLRRVTVPIFLTRAFGRSLVPESTVP